MNPYVYPGLQTADLLIDKAVCRVWNIYIKELYIKTNKRNYVEARYIAMYYRRIVLHQKLPAIAKYTGFDHSTVSYACKTITNLLQVNKEFQNKYDQFLNVLYK